MSRRDVTPHAAHERTDSDFYGVALQDAVDALIDGWEATVAVVVRRLSPAGSVAAVWDFDHASRELICRCCTLDDLVERRLPLGSGVAGWVASHRRSVAVADRRADPRGDHYSDDPRVPTAGAAVPIPGGDYYTGGVLEVYGPHGNSITDADLSALGRLAAVIAAGKRDADAAAATESLAAAAPQSSITEVERQNRRMAAELHDGVSQRLASLSFHLSAATAALAELGPDPSSNDPVRFALAQVEVATELGQLAAEDVRAAISGLRPPVLDDLGLAKGLVSLCGALGAEGLTVEVDVEAVEPPFVAPAASLALYRVAQEALGNAVKHAGVASVRVRLERRGGNVVLDVRDDGVGYQQAADGRAGPRSGIDNGLGLRSMTERMKAIGGHIELWSAPGRGTHVRAIVRDYPR